MKKILGILLLVLLLPTEAKAQKICDYASGAPALATDYIEVSKNCAGTRKLTLAQVKTYMLDSLTVPNGTYGQITVTGSTWTINDPELSAIAGLTSAANALPYFTGVGAAATATLTDAGRTFIAAVDAPAQKAILGLRQEYCYAMSDQGTSLTTGTSKTTFFFPAAATVNGIRSYVNTAPTGSTLIVDCNEAGTTIMSTTKLSIDASEKTSGTAASAAVISDSSIGANAEMTCDIDQVGSTIPGKGLVVCLDVSF